MIAASAIGAGVGKSNIPYLSHLQREEAGSLFMPNMFVEQNTPYLLDEMFHSKKGEKSMVKKHDSNCI